MTVQQIFFTISSGATGYQGPLGLTSSLAQYSGETGIWTQQTGVDISEYYGATARLVYRSVSTTNYTSDFQLDDITFDGNSYTFEADNQSWQRNVTRNVSTYSAVTWEAIPNGAGGTSDAGWWVRYSGNTPSGSTGDIGAHGGTYYIYYEASTSGAGFPYVYAWVRSPEVVLTEAPTLTFWEGRDGATIGTIDVYLDITATA